MRLNTKKNHTGINKPADIINGGIKNKINMSMDMRSDLMNAN